MLEEVGNFEPLEMSSFPYSCVVSQKVIKGGAGEEELAQGAVVKVIYNGEPNVDCNVLECALWSLLFHSVCFQVHVCEAYKSTFGNTMSFIYISGYVQKGRKARKKA